MPYIRGMKLSRTQVACLLKIAKRTDCDGLQTNHRINARRALARLGLVEYFDAGTQKYFEPRLTGKGLFYVSTL